MEHINFYKNQGSVDNCLELLEMSESCLWLINKDYKLLAFNKIYVSHMQHFVNVTPSVGDNDVVLACFPKDFADNILDMYNKALAGEVVKSIDKGFNTDGSTADVVMIFKPVKDDAGSIIGVCCMRKDITEYVKIKEELEKDKNKLSEISWQQSHLYRGPLSTALGIVNLLLDESNVRELTDVQCKELLQGMKDRLLELDHQIHNVVHILQK